MAAKYEAVSVQNGISAQNIMVSQDGKLVSLVDALNALNGADSNLAQDDVKDDAELLAARIEVKSLLKSVDKLKKQLAELEKKVEEVKSAPAAEEPAAKETPAEEAPAE